MRCVCAGGFSVRVIFRKWRFAEIFMQSDSGIMGGKKGEKNSPEWRFACGTA